MRVSGSGRPSLNVRLKIIIRAGGVGRLWRGGAAVGRCPGRAGIGRVLTPVASLRAKGYIIVCPINRKKKRCDAKRTGVQ